MKTPKLAPLLAAALCATLAATARADAVTDWNATANELIAESKLGTPPAMRVMAIVQTAVHGAVVEAPAATRDAAVAAANRAALVALLPQQQAAIETAYQAALARLGDAASPSAGIAAGERAAASVLAARAAEASVLATPDTTRPHIGGEAGVWVPTALPAATAWPRRTPWLMTSASQFRPAAPPALTSAAWARDFNEVKAFGGRSSTRRSAEQTEIARFWEYSLPPVYHGVLRSAAQTPGRDLLANARLFAAAAQAMDDALIAVFDAKHHYNFWRPMTAVRHADVDGNDATAPEASWQPLVENPMHPEYPSGHSILAGAIGAVLHAELGRAPVRLATTSPTAKGVQRQWSRIDDFVQEVADARVWGGLHYRFSNETALGMGRAIGTLAAERVLARAPAEAL